MQGLQQTCWMSDLPLKLHPIQIPLTKNTGWKRGSVIKVVWDWSPNPVTNL